MNKIETLISVVWQVDFTLMNHTPYASVIVGAVGVEAPAVGADIVQIAAHDSDSPTSENLSVQKHHCRKVDGPQQQRKGSQAKQTGSQGRKKYWLARALKDQDNHCCRFLKKISFIITEFV
jgi:hypothetical protein